MTGDWRKLPSDELHKLYFSPDIIRMTKSMMVKWAGNEHTWRKMRSINKIVVGLVGR
jgi:hypothetical protein